MSAVLQRLLHKIEEYAGDPEFAPELKAAKEKFFAGVGQPGEKGAKADAEVELSNFIEWFIFDWKLPDGQSIWAKFIRFKGAEFDPDELDILKQLDHQVYSLFHVKRIGEKAAVKDIVSRKSYRPISNLTPAVQPGDLFLGRMIAINGKYFFTEAIFMIPRALEEIYKPHSKLVRKGKMGQDDFTDEVRGLTMKTIRYPKMKVVEFHK